MKIAWFTPLSESTGIARFSDAVLHSLVEHADVEVWAEPADNDIPLECCPVHVIDDPAVAARAVAGFDVRVYNLGNNPAFHGSILATSELARGVAVIHDKVMHNFFYIASEVRYRRLMRYYYGREGSEAAERALADNSLLGDGDFVERFPLVEPCLWNAEAVVAHSAHSAEALARRYGDILPVEWLHLPLCQRDLSATRPLARRAELGLPEDRVVIVAAGRVGRGKRIETVLEAIGRSALLRERCFFAIVGGGEPDYVEELVAYVAENDLGDVVKFVPKADDWLLQSYLSASDICVNLRYPSTESSSASLVEQLYYGKPAVVYDIGVYSETPDDIVVKVRVEDGAAGVGSALERLTIDTASREAMGQRGAAYVRENQLPDTYASRFVELAGRLIERRPALQRIDDASEQLLGHRTLPGLRRAAARLAASLADE